MSRVSIHLVFPVNFEPYVEEVLNSTHFQDCALRNEFKDKFSRQEHDIFYPINVGRNVAREAANTYFVMVTDIELIPSAHLAENFLEMMFLKEFSPITQVYVVPTFEVDIGYELPLNKKDLLNLVDAGAAVYFHKFTCTHCQKFPGIDTWLMRKDIKGIEVSTCFYVLNLYSNRLISNVEFTEICEGFVAVSLYFLRHFFKSTQSRIRKFPFCVEPGTSRSPSW